MTAHPDDEAGSFGGTLVKLAAAGTQTMVVCLTAGEAARNRGRAVDNEDLAAMRAKELARACEILKVGSHQIWSYPDAHLPEANFHEAVGRLVKVLREFRPQVVITLGPEGGLTAHPDHGMAGLMATAAFHWAANEKFYVAQAKPPHQAERLFYGTGVAQPPTARLALLPPVDVEVDIAAYLEVKVAAFKAHLTQAPLAERFEAFARLSGGVERFHLAAAPLGCERALLQASGDLFHGCGAAVDAA